jgi:3-oxoisoapionate kinase
VQPRLAFYGDDFTGSADVMEVLQWAGVPTILFLAPPSREQLQSFSRFQAIGVAGSSRAMSPNAMELELKPVFQQLRDTGARVVHYKTCSTFDSSPEIGSIGKAIEIGRVVFGSRIVPMVIGAPNLGRYQVFGNLFARSGLDSEPYRLDRHPTMIHHPITPMNESDLRVHLSAQTDLRLGLYDILKLQTSESSDYGEPDKTADCDALLFDVLYPEHLTKIGSILDRMTTHDSPSFVVGSSGIEYALTAFWASRSEISQRAINSATTRPTFGPVSQLVVMTGSCSPVNARQIDWAEQHGFETLSLDASRLIDPQTSCTEIESMIDGALERLNRGLNLILHTSRGPTDPRIVTTLQLMRSQGLTELEIRLQSGVLLGPKLGKILKGILAQRSFSRVGIAGGDSSGFIARELGLTALEAIAPVAPGSPLCRAYAQNELDGVEFLFKGGQVGKDDVWRTMLDGTK